MFSLFERKVSWRYLRARRSEGFISVIAGFSFLGIMLGVATLIIVMSVMNGFRQELMNQILGFNGHINVECSRALPAYNQVSKNLAHTPHVASVIPLIERQVMVTHQAPNREGANMRYAAGGMIHGIEPKDLRGRQKIADSIKAGSLQNFSGNKIAVGTRLADRMRLKIGDFLTVISPDGTQTAFGTSPRMKSYEVAAVFEVGMAEYDNLVVFMPLESAQTFFRMKNDVSSLQVFLDDANLAEQTTALIQHTLGQDFKVSDWQKRNASYFNAIKVERNVMFLILSLIILIAAFNVISSMIMLVKDKGRDIAILRTMGATRGMIMRIFLLTGSSIGVVGTGVGFLLGTGFALNIESIRQAIQNLSGSELFPAEIYFLSHLPAKVDSYEVLLVVFMSLGLSFLATVYPSWRAARLDPVEALRYE